MAKLIELFKPGSDLNKAIILLFFFVVIFVVVKDEHTREIVGRWADIFIGVVAMGLTADIKAAAARLSGGKSGDDSNRSDAA